MNLQLSDDEALVLFDWLARHSAGEHLPFEDQAEQRVLWDLEAQLERVLAAPLRADYAHLLAAARANVRDPASDNGTQQP